MVNGGRICGGRVCDGVARGGAIRDGKVRGRRICGGRRGFMPIIVTSWKEGWYWIDVQIVCVKIQ